MTDSVVEDVTEAPPLLLTPEAAGKLLSVSADHVYRLIASGVLESVNAAQPGSKKSKTRVPLDAVHEYIAWLRRKNARQAEPAPLAA